MCGIVTIVTADGKRVGPDILESMTNRLAHRGPDDCGYASVDPRSGTARAWARGAGSRDLAGILFGHRRLSILDLTPGGHQPMFSDDGSTVVAYNGEIYNYVELKRELESQGVTFRSRSDTEVLLKAYQHWGDDAFRRFNGMWAFTLWDGRARRLVACRDRFGVKPLYYAERDGTWLFASEIKALLAFPGAFRGFRDENIRRFVDHNRVDVDDSTMFRDIWALSPGTCLELAGSASVRRRYWALAIDDRHAGRSDAELIEQYRALFNDSVRLRVRSDVPIATMLSGGMDSTSITAQICEQRAARDGSGFDDTETALSGFHHTFTACWPGWRGDEEARVDSFCEKRGLESHKIYLTSERMGDALHKVVYHLDEPFQNPTSLVQYLLMEEARSKGIKVVLNGHGSDEVLAGYPLPFVPPFLAQLILGAHPIRFLRNRRAFRQFVRFTDRQIYDQLVNGLEGAVRRTVRRGSAASQNVDPDGMRVVPYFQRKDAVDSPDGLSLLTTELWRRFAGLTLPKWLRMEDRVSMACSVESRLPFLDYRLVEFSFNLPAHLLLRDGYTKVVLREAMKGSLPPAILAERTKRRFDSPYGEWFGGNWRALLEDTLGGNCMLHAHIDTTRLQQGLASFLAGNREALGAEKIWRALSTELFLRTFSANAPSAS